MNCERACELIALAASGDVTLAEQAAIDRHMTSCAACREEATAVGVLTDELAAIRGDSLPESAFAAVRTRVVEELASRRKLAWLRAWPAFAAAMACTAIVAVLLRPVTTPPPLPVEQAEVLPQPLEQPSAAPPVAPVHSAKPRVTRIHKPSGPLVIQMLTNDPNVVIYWIADARDGRAGKESNP
jgi:anti-sigma factor RsiW